MDKTLRNTKFNAIIWILLILAFVFFIFLTNDSYTATWRNTDGSIGIASRDGSGIYGIITTLLGMIIIARIYLAIPLATRSDFSAVFSQKLDKREFKGIDTMGITIPEVIVLVELEISQWLRGRGYNI